MARPAFKKTVYLGLVLLLLVSGLVLVQRPWSVAALREGYPAHQWPSGGNFAEQGDRRDVDSVYSSAPSVGSGEFEAAFRDSGGMAFVIVKNNEVLFSKFGDGYSAESEFNSYSMAKGLVGLLAIKAISDGVIADIEITVGELWPMAADTAVADVTLRELLDMRSGIAFEKDPSEVGNVDGAKKDQAATFGPFSRLAKLHVEGVDAVVDEARLIEADRGRFSYQNLNTAILARTLEEVHGASIDQLLYDTIAEPAGAGGFRWREHTTAEQVSAYCCMYADVQWWVSIARFVMENGASSANAEPFLADEWHAYIMGNDFTDEQNFDGRYRSQLNYNVLDREGEALHGPFLYFSGLGGQVTYLVPGSDLIVIRFGETYQLLHTTLYQASRLTDQD